MLGAARVLRWNKRFILNDQKRTIFVFLIVYTKLKLIFSFFAYGKGGDFDNVCCRRASFFLDFSASFDYAAIFRRKNLKFEVEKSFTID